jgi:hypothetical protein
MADRPPLRARRRRLACAASLMLSATLLTPPGLAGPAEPSQTGYLQPERTKTTRLKAASTAAGHARTLPYDPDPPAVVARPLPDRRHYDRIAYVLAQPAARTLALSRDLSNACRRGEFNQQIEFMYRGFGPGERAMGVAFGTGPINLIDTKARRQAGQVYFFGHNAGQCLVYVGDMATLRPFLVEP